MKEKDLEEHLQAYADDTWNVNLTYPSERKSKTSEEKFRSMYVKMSPAEQAAIKAYMDTM